MAQRQDKDQDQDQEKDKSFDDDFDGFGPSGGHFLDDMARMATGAFSAMNTIREQLQGEVKSQVNRLIMQLDFVPREDFEVLEDRVNALQKELADLKSPVKAQKTTKKTTKKKAAAGKKKTSTAKKTTQKTASKTRKK